MLYNKLQKWSGLHRSEWLKFICHLLAESLDVELAINHAVFVRGDPTNSQIDPSLGVEASELYPDVKYTTVEEYLDQFVWD